MGAPRSSPRSRGWPAGREPRDGGRLVGSASRERGFWPRHEAHREGPAGSTSRGASSGLLPSEIPGARPAGTGLAAPRGVGGDYFGFKCQPGPVRDRHRPRLGTQHRSAIGMVKRCQSEAHQSISPRISSAVNELLVRDHLRIPACCHRLPRGLRLRDATAQRGANRRSSCASSGRSSGGWPALLDA
jgi:hypothetical protein